MMNRALPRSLERSQRDIAKRLSAIIAQLGQQADSTFAGKSWASVSWPQFADKLITDARALLELGERLKSGALPQWKVDQTEACEKSALGQSMKRKEENTSE